MAAAALLLVFLFVLSRLFGGGGGGDDEQAVTTTTKPVTTTTLPAPPACTVGDEPVRGRPNHDWATIIVDTARRLPDDYEPDGLVDAEAAGFPPGFKLRSFVIADLKAMREASVANGTPIGLIAAYRSAAQQADLYNRRERELGPQAAAHRAARGGHSEHQLGTSIDVADAGDLDVFQEWGTTATGQWVATHAHEFGFVLSYPQGGAGTSCYDYEPWHLRYVGRERAAAVVASGLTLRAYLWAESRGVMPAPTTTTTAAPRTTTTG